jgi:hypothetical protein
MVPYTLSETVFNDGLRTMATFFVGRPIGGATTAPTLTGGYPNMPMGYDQHWSFGFQRELPKNSALELNYVGNRGVNLYGADPINDPLAGPGAIQARRPYPIFGAITYNAQDNSTIYHALQAKLEKRVSAGLWYLVSYTWSKSLTVADTPAVGGDYAYERAISSFDIPQNLTASVGYELPMGRGKPFLSSANRFANGVLGGWQLQGIMVLRTGRPFTPTISRDVANTGIGGQRPNRIGSGQLSNPRSPFRRLIHGAIPGPTSCGKTDSRTSTSRCSNSSWSTNGPGSNSAPRRSTSPTLQASPRPAPISTRRPAAW